MISIFGITIKGMDEVRRIDGGKLELVMYLKGHQIFALNNIADKNHLRAFFQIHYEK